MLFKSMLGGKFLSPEILFSRFEYGNQDRSLTTEKTGTNVTLCVCVCVSGWSQERLPWWGSPVSSLTGKETVSEVAVCSRPHHQGVAEPGLWF